MPNRGLQSPDDLLVRDKIIRNEADLDSLESRVDRMHGDLMTAINTNYDKIYNEIKELKTIAWADHDKITNHDSQLSVLRKVSGAILVAILSMGVAIARWALGIV